MLLDLYSKALWEIGSPEAFYSAWLDVIECNTFRPDIAEIRRAAGINRGIQDPTEQEAMRELKFLIAAMRLHGPELAPIPGKITRWADDQGVALAVPVRDSPTPGPVLNVRTERALVELGMGSREAGLEAISCHPALPWNSARHEDLTQRIFRAKNAAEIERSWIQAYAGVR